MALQNSSNDEWVICPSQEQDSAESQGQSREKSKTKTKKIRKPDRFVRNFWNEQEDNRLRELVGRYGNTKWTLIASEMSGRSPKRCRQRWMNYLDTQRNKQSSWTVEERWLLYLCFRVYGNKWSIISGLLKRGDNVVKNQINSLKRKKMWPFENQLSQILADKEYYLTKTQSDGLQSDLLQRICKQKQSDFNQNALQMLKSQKQSIIQVNQIKQEPQQNQQITFNNGFLATQTTSHTEEFRNWWNYHYFTQNNPIFWLLQQDTIQLNFEGVPFTMHF